MTNYLTLYNNLTKKELICTLIARDEMLKNCRERFELHKTTDAHTIQDQSDLIDVLNKALELACEEIQCEDCPLKLNDGECDFTVVGCKIALSNYLKTKAKEMMKSE